MCSQALESLAGIQHLKALKELKARTNKLSTILPCAHMKVRADPWRTLC